MRIAILVFMLCGVVFGGETAAQKIASGNLEFIQKCLNAWAQPGRIVFSQDESANVGGFSFVVNGSCWKDRLAANGYKTKADARFLIVDLAITNALREAAIVPALALVDENGTVYVRSTNYVMDMNNDIARDKGINPDVTAKGKLFFDVTDGHRYYLCLPGLKDTSVIRLDPEKLNAPVNTEKQVDATRYSASGSFAAPR